MLHRLPEQHECLFDHLGHGRQEAVLKMVKLDRKVGRSCQRIGEECSWATVFHSQRTICVRWCLSVNRDMIFVFFNFILQGLYWFSLQECKPAFFHLKIQLILLISEHCPLFVYFPLPIGFIVSCLLRCLLENILMNPTKTEQSGAKKNTISSLSWEFLTIQVWMVWKWIKICWENMSLYTIVCFGN